jgi:hypothetical protein
MSEESALERFVICVASWDQRACVGQGLGHVGHVSALDVYHTETYSSSTRFKAVKEVSIGSMEPWVFCNKTYGCMGIARSYLVLSVKRSHMWE